MSFVCGRGGGLYTGGADRDATLCQLAGPSIDPTGCDGYSLNLDLYVREDRYPDTTWTRTEGGCIGGNNLKYYAPPVTVTECEALCIAYGPSCMGFEYGVEYARMPSNPEGR